MCGIAALVVRGGTLGIERSIQNMTDAVTHRGPDDSGIFVLGNVALGHRRLSIVDLTRAGRQPMESATGRFVITYNGEIYNYVELRQELKDLGYRFSSNTDTEVVLNAFDAWGTSCLGRFNGMWGLALLDRQRRRLILARDRFGVKPVYYVTNDRLTAVGSEIRQLLPLLDKRRANAALLGDYLMTSVSERREETFFEDVRKLPAGHFAELSTETGVFQLKQFYDLEAAVASRDVRGMTPPDFGELLDDAVRFRLRADVTVGTCLSGGLDSSTIAALASRRFRAATGGQRFVAITAVSTEDASSEEAYAKVVVEAADLEWHRVTPSYDDFCKHADRVIEAQEEPFGTPSIVMQYFVMQAARQANIKVMLDGQGGDETMLGYESYFMPFFVSLARGLSLRRLIHEVVLAHRNNARLSLSRLLRYAGNNLFPKLRARYYQHRAAYLKAPAPCSSWLSAMASARFDITRTQLLEISETNLPGLLRFEDKNSMAVAIETRLPFLDFRVVETALALPVELKIRDGWSKWALREVCASHLPETIAWRRNKLGFEAPSNTWLSLHRDTMREATLTSGFIDLLVDRKAMVSRYESLDLLSRWRLYCVARWADLFRLDGLGRGESED